MTDLKAYLDRLEKRLKGDPGAMAFIARVKRLGDGALGARRSVRAEEFRHAAPPVQPHVDGGLGPL